MSAGSVINISPIRTLDDLESYHMDKQFFTNREELRSILMRTLVQQGATVWDLPPEGKFINSAAKYKLLTQEDRTIPMGDIPVLFNEQLYFLKVLFFKRRRSQRAASGMELSSQKLTNRQVKCLKQGDGLLLLICEPSIGIPPEVIQRGGDYCVNWYHEKLRQSKISYEAILLNQNDFLQFKSQVLDKGRYSRDKRIHVSFQKVGELFPTKLHKFKLQEILDGALATLILNNSVFSTESPQSTSIEKTKELRPDEEGLLQPQVPQQIAPNVQGLVALFKVVGSSPGRLRLWQIFLEQKEASLDALANLANLHPKTVREYMNYLIQQGIIQEITINQQKGYRLDLSSLKIQGIKAALDEFLNQFPTEAKKQLSVESSIEKISSFLRNITMNTSSLRIFQKLLEKGEISLHDLAKFIDLHPKTIKRYMLSFIQQGIIQELQTNSDKIYRFAINMSQLQELWHFLHNTSNRLNARSSLQVEEGKILAEKISKEQSKVRPMESLKEAVPEELHHELKKEPGKPQITRLEQKILKILSLRGELGSSEIVREGKLDINSVEASLKSLVRSGLLQKREVFSINSDFLIRIFEEQDISSPSSSLVVGESSGKPNLTKNEVEDHPAVEPQPERIFLSTLGHQPYGIIQSAKMIGKSKFLIVHDVKKKEIDKVESIFYKYLRKEPLLISGIKMRPVFMMKIDEIIKFIRKWISENHQKGRQIFLNLGEGSQRLTISLLYAAYREFDKIKGIFCYSPESAATIKLPVFPWCAPDIPPTDPYIKGDLDLAPFADYFTRPASSSIESSKQDSYLGKTLITTLGHLPYPLINAVKHLNCTKVIILHRISENRINSILKKLKHHVTIPIQVKSIQSLNINECISLLHDLIQQEFEANQAVILNLSGGAQKLTIAMVFVSYLEFNRIYNFFYTPATGAAPIELPRMPWNI